MSVIGACIVPHPPLIIPEVGRGEEKDIEATVSSYEECAERIAALKPDTILFISPHTTIYADYFHISPGSRASGDFGRFGAQSVSEEIVYDRKLVEAISKEADDAGIAAGTMGERDRELDHATLIPMHFINREYSDYKAVRMGFSGMPAIKQYRLGQCVAEAAAKLGRRLFVVASGDLSHKLKDEGPYGFDEEGPVFDKAVTEVMASGDFLGFLNMPDCVSGPAAECGLRSFQVMSGVLDRLAVEPELLSYEGPFGVGYAVAWFGVTGRDDSRNFGEQYIECEARRLGDIRRKESAPVRLARYTVEGYVRKGRIPPRPADIAGEIEERRAGVFVSLHESGELRGCIGTFLPTMEDIASEIMSNAVSACSRDPRFEPVEEGELDDLEYSVDVLTDPEKIDSCKDLDPKKYGVIVTKGSRRGLLLPDLDGVDTVAGQISIAKRKAGIKDSEDVELQRFEVTRYR